MSADKNRFLKKNEGRNVGASVFRKWQKDRQLEKGPDKEKSCRKTYGRQVPCSQEVLKVGY
jgi:hypothetical protein